MKSFGILLTVVAVAGAFAMAAANAVAQTSGDCMASAAAGTSAACQPVEEVALVHAALNQFDSALARHNVGELQAEGVRPSSAKRWQRFFKENPRASVTDSCPAWALVISGDTARWGCTETATIISEGKPLTFAREIRFTFSKKSGAWMIADRR